MGRIRGLRPSYASVTATLALVLALGMGGAYAAGKIHSKDITPSAVKSKHIKDGQVRARDLHGIEPVRLVGTPGNPDFAPDWKNYNTAVYPGAGFYKDQFGIVHLTGTVDPPGYPGTVFTLPAGYRPAPGPIATRFGVNGDVQMTTLQVRFDGQVEVSQARNGSVALDGVAFRAGQ